MTGAVDEPTGDVDEQVSELFAELPIKQIVELLAEYDEHPRIYRCGPGCSCEINPETLNPCRAAA